MIMFALIIGLKMSTTGPRMPCKGSNKPHESACGCVPNVEGFSFDGDFLAVSGSPFLRLPFLSFEPMVPALGREDTPALRALTKSLQ